MPPRFPRPPSLDARAMTPRQALRAFLWTRLWLLLALALTQGLTLLAVLWVDRQNTERVLGEQARSALTSLVRIASVNTRAYLQTAAQTVTINSQNLAQGLLSADDPATLTLNFQTLLSNVPQLSGVLLGQSDGSFTFVRRDGPDDLGRFVRVIETQPTRRVITTRWDASGSLTTQSLAPDPFDPRRRPWYSRARTAPNTLVWTEPYIFASSRLPGITVATAARRGPAGGPNAGWVVMGADVGLRDLASFLRGVPFSENGRAFISDSQGHAIATSRAWPVQTKGRLPLLSEVGDPALRALLDSGGHISLGGTTLDETDTSDHSPSAVARRYQVDGQPYAAVIRQIEIQPGMIWTVGVYAPESDFTQGLSGTARRHTLMILFASLLSGLLAWPILYRATRPLAALQHQATTDPLTRLHNRAAFLAQLSETLAARRGSADELGVVLFDLDGFKAINDSHGHSVGDEVLRAVGGRLLAAVRSGDTLGRLGGDEFALIMTGRSRDEIQGRALAILSAVGRRPVSLDGSEYPLTATAGLAFDSGGKSPVENRATELLIRADGALIGGKRRGKGQVWVTQDGELLSLGSPQN